MKHSFFTSRFGALLQEWPAMVEAARALREEERGLFGGCPVGAGPP